MTGPEYDAELEAFLKRRSPMHRRLSDSDGSEPSVELDRLVLNRAREAIETPSQPLFRTSRWALPMGLAAAILIAFTVVLNIEHHEAKVASNASPAAEAAAQTPAPMMASNRAVAIQDAPAGRPAPANPQPQAPAAAAPSPPPAAVASTDPHSSPDAWLQEINRLRTAGQTADADRELAAFREAYPKHPAYSVAKPPAR
jgi:hypothetical protein